MNFLVSNNNGIIEQFQKVLVEWGSLELLHTYTELLMRGELCDNGFAIIDVTVPDYGGIAGLKQLKSAHATLKILLVVEQQPPVQELAALAAGAMGCCAPGLSEVHIRRIISIVEEGGVWISTLALPQLLNHLRKHSVPAESIPALPPEASSQHLDGMTALTHREREISRMVAEGLSNKLIARKLDISDRTVKAHLTAVFQKLNVHDRLQLALYVTKGVRN